MPSTISPLRYPGGKSKLIPYVIKTMELNDLIGGSYVEPFAGGAAIAWYLLLNEKVNNVYVNDLNPSIFAFWYSIFNSTDSFVELVESTPVTVEEWHRQRKIQTSKSATILELGFSTFFLNRTNRSGILSAGIIGGYSQEGKYKIDCRFNKKNLISQIRKISMKRESVFISNLDAIDFIEEVVSGIDDKCLINIDPPYYDKGKELYQNFLKHEDHCRLRDCVVELDKPWILTYDDTPEINDLYRDFKPKSFGLTYTAQVKRKGAEVIVVGPKCLPCDYRPDISFSEIDKIIKGQL